MSITPGLYGRNLRWLAGVGSNGAENANAFAAASIAVTTVKLDQPDSVSPVARIVIETSGALLVETGGLLIPTHRSAARQHYEIVATQRVVPYELVK